MPKFFTYPKVGNHWRKSGYVDRKWVDLPLVPFGEIEQVVELADNGECIQDLQCGSLTCYFADVFKSTTTGADFVFLIGNGWSEESGFPFSPETGRYPILGGTTMRNMVRISKEDRIPDWSDVFSGKMKDLWIEKVEKKNRAIC